MSDRTAARDLFRDVIALAPMATGGNLPYRRLCREFGAELTCSEMILAHKLAKGSRREMPLLRRHESESPFGIQIAAGKPAAMGEGARVAASHEPDYIDLNFGCPIDVMVRRGIGAAALKRPARLAAMIASARAVTDLPLLVKIRAGWSERKVNGVASARIAEAEGADAVSIHGRTREQRYRRDADWSIIGEVADAVDIPVLGNGDILLPGDREHHLEETSVSGVVVARGALIKPWIFRELRSGEVWHPTVAERWGVMRRYFEMAAEYFGDDEKGLSRVERFLVWHLGFWHRYRPYTDADQAASDTSLIQQRNDAVPDEPEERLLYSGREEDHRLIWRRLLDKDHPGV